MRLVRGTTVTVSRRVRTGTDRYNRATYGTEASEVGDVLPQPGAATDLDASRPEGVRVAMTFHWPRTDHRSLRGATVTHAGRAYRVIGDPQPYLGENVPGPWDRAVECEAVDG